MKNNNFLFGILLVFLSQNVFSLNIKSMEEKLKDLDDTHKAEEEYTKELSQWIKKSDLLIKRIDKVIAQWHKEKSRDLEKEAIQQAISEIENAIIREKQLNENTGKTSSYLKKLINHKKTLKSKF